MRAQVTQEWKTPELRQWLVALTVVQAARQWVGHRRNTSVRALTTVSVVVLAQSDMQWAVEHDYRLSGELQVRQKHARLSAPRLLCSRTRAHSSLKPRSAFVPAAASRLLAARFVSGNDSEHALAGGLIGCACMARVGGSTRRRRQ